MKKKSKRTLTPKLRFPEFRKEPGWEGLPIGGKVDLLSGFPFDGNDISEDSSGTRLLRGINITEGMIRHGVDIDRYFLGNKDKLNKFELNIGDLVIGMDGSKVGKNSSLISANDAGSLLIQRVARLRSNDPDLAKFIFLHINSPKFHRYVDKINTSSGIPHISAKQIRDFIVFFPSKPEQQKIVGCLSSLDELIAAEGRKLAALRDHKRGLMQQLFPQPGQTQPRLRFPEFRDKGEWEIKPLGKIAEIKLGKMLDKNKHRSGRLLPYLNNLAVRWNDFNTSDLPEMYFNDDELEKYGLSKGDVIVCEGGEPGRSAVWDGRLPGLKFQKALHRVRFKIQFVPHLLVHYLETIAGTSAFESLFTGGGIKHLTRQTFARLTIPIASPAEQKRIADCLTFLDDQIAAQAEKIETLKQHKRGLMQQLFPSPEVS